MINKNVAQNTQGWTPTEEDFNRLVDSNIAKMKLNPAYATIDDKKISDQAIQKAYWDMIRLTGTDPARVQAPFQAPGQEQQMPTNIPSQGSSGNALVDMSMGVAKQGLFGQVPQAEQATQADTAQVENTDPGLTLFNQVMSQYSPDELALKFGQPKTPTQVPQATPPNYDMDPQEKAQITQLPQYAGAIPGYRVSIPEILNMGVGTAGYVLNKILDKNQYDAMMKLATEVPEDEKIKNDERLESIKMKTGYQGDLNSLEPVVKKNIVDYIDGKGNSAIDISKIDLNDAATYQKYIFEYPTVPDSDRMGGRGILDKPTLVNMRLAGVDMFMAQGKYDLARSLYESTVELSAALTSWDSFYSSDNRNMYNAGTKGMNEAIKRYGEKHKFLKSDDTKKSDGSVSSEKQSKMAQLEQKKRELLTETDPDIKAIIEQTIKNIEAQIKLMK